MQVKGYTDYPFLEVSPFPIRPITISHHFWQTHVGSWNTGKTIHLATTSGKTSLIWAYPCRLYQRIHPQVYTIVGWLSLRLPSRRIHRVTSLRLVKCHLYSIIWGIIPHAYLAHVRYDIMDVFEIAQSAACSKSMRHLRIYEVVVMQELLATLAAPIMSVRNKYSTWQSWQWNRECQKWRSFGSLAVCFSDQKEWDCPIHVSRGSKKKFYLLPLIARLSRGLT